MTPELPELPQAKNWLDDGESWTEDTPVYTADQMRAYGAECARLATIAERERAASIADNFPTLHGFHSCFSVAAAIRKG